MCTGRARGVPCTPRWSTACGTRCARWPGSMPWGSPPAPRGGGFWDGLRVRGARDGTGALASHGLSRRAEDAPLLWGQGAPPPQSGAHTPPLPPPLCAPVMDRPRGDATGRSRPVPRGSAIVPPPPRGPQTGLWDLGPGPWATSVPEVRRLPWRTIGRESAGLMPARGQRRSCCRWAERGRSRSGPRSPSPGARSRTPCHTRSCALRAPVCPVLCHQPVPCRRGRSTRTARTMPRNSEGRSAGGVVVACQRRGSLRPSRASRDALAGAAPRDARGATPGTPARLAPRRATALPLASPACAPRADAPVPPPRLAAGPAGLQSGGAPVAAAPVAPGPLAPRPVAPGPPPPGAGAPAHAPPAHGAPPPPPDRVLALPGQRVRRNRGPRDDRDRPEQRSAAPRHGVPGDAPRDRRCPSRAVRLSRDRGPRGDRAHPPGGCGAAGAHGRGTAPSAERREPLLQADGPLRQRPADDPPAASTGRAARRSTVLWPLDVRAGISRVGQETPHGAGAGRMPPRLLRARPPPWTRGQRQVFLGPSGADGPGAPACGALRTEARHTRPAGLVGLAAHGASALPVSSHGPVTRQRPARRWVPRPGLPPQAQVGPGCRPSARTYAMANASCHPALGWLLCNGFAC